jgi:hypothetical protein
MTCPTRWHVPPLQICQQVPISGFLFSVSISIGTPFSLSFVACMQLILKLNNTLELGGLIIKHIGVQ